jgi:hypothetical protein
VSEDRRILTLLYWFAFDPVRRRYGLTLNDILTAFALCACIYLIVAVGLQFLLPDRLSGREIPDLDTRRLRMSAPGDCFAISFLAGLTGRLASRRRTVDIVLLVVGLIGRMLGEVFRVGFFYAAFVWAYVATGLRLWQRIGSAQHKAIIASIYLFYFLQAPTDGFFYRLGFVHAFLFLLMSAAATRTHRILSTTYRTPSLHPLPLGHFRDDLNSVATLMASRRHCRPEAVTAMVRNVMA